MMSRPFATLAALILWLLLAVLWVAWLALLVVAYCACRTKRGRRKVMGALPRFPSPARIRDWFPGRRRVEPAEARSIRRMSSRRRAELVAVLADRDGLWCQQCGRALDPTAHHLADEHPEVHHLVAWCKAKGLWWCDEPVNLVLLDGRCNRAIGDGTTRRLEAKRRELLAWYGYEEAA